MSDYDLFVIGGGSGGLSAAKRTAQYGARVAIAEQSLLGGTCAARGCIPKKLMVYASKFSNLFRDAVGYGWDKVEPHFNWQKLLTAINEEIHRLDKSHFDSLEKAGVDVFRDRATLVDHNVIALGEQTFTSEKILIAVGGKAIKPDIPGIEHAIISDQMFHLAEQPKHLAIVGGGYIGVEFAGIMYGLGSQVTQLIRDEEILEGFDQEIRAQVQKGMIQHGINLLTNIEVKKIVKESEGLRLELSNEQSLFVDAILFAIGRVPNFEGLGLEKVGVEVEKKAIAVNEYSQTSQSHIYAVGDCTDRKNLTPVAIAEAQAFADTVFGNKPRQVNYKNIPSSVFGQPQAASVGLATDEALEQLGQDNVVLYCTMFTPLFHKLTGADEVAIMKLIVDKNTDHVVGAHMVGENAAEIIQMAAIAVNAGLTKKDFDATMPLHPTSAEEFVTLQKTEMPADCIEPGWMG